MKKVIIVALTVGLMGLTPVPSAQAQCAKNWGHCSIKYDSKGTKWCKPKCFHGTNNKKQGWGR